MSGHNKWSTIKRKKGALDAKRSKIFSRIVKEIQVAIKEGGPDVEGNARLRMAVQNAKGVNMPKDNIQRAINKASDEGANFQEMTYEGYLPGGVAIFIECLSDNNNRTVSNMRQIFTKRGGTLGNNGSLAFIFDRKGVFTLQKSQIKDMDEFELEIIDAGVEDIEVGDEVLVLTCPMESFGAIQKKFDAMSLEVENAELRRIPNDTKSVDLSTAQKILRIIDDFEEDDDVQNVFHNMELTDEIMSSLE